MKYFENCKTINDAKALYRKLCLSMHPDKGGVTADFQEMQRQFENFKASEGKQFEANEADDFMKIIQKLSEIDSILIELIGSWLWISGNTRENIDKIKGAVSGTGYVAMWNRERQLWQIHEKGYRRLNGETLTKDELETKYGKVLIKGNQQKVIN